MMFTHLHADDAAALSSESAIRRSYLRFPAWSQPLWTAMTGKPLSHERAPRQRPLVGLALSLALLLALAGLQMLALSKQELARPGLLFCLPAALLMAGRWRALQVVYGHHAVHATLLRGGESVNQLAARLLTLCSLSQNEREYEREHLDHHRRLIFTTLDDADASLLFRCGLRPGLAPAVLRRRLALTLLSPRFHAVFLLSRLRSNLRRPGGWSLLALAWMVLVFVLAPLLLGWLPALLILWLPLVPLYQMSALLQFFTEHVWLQSRQGPSSMQQYAQRCHGRFCGEALPAVGAGLLLWLRWWARTALLHLPTRLWVLVGDLPAHDWHHLCSWVRHRPDDWHAAIYERQRAIDSGRSAGMEDRELWGLDRMLAHGLTQLAAAAPLAQQTAAVPEAA